MTIRFKNSQDDTLLKNNFNFIQNLAEQYQLIKLNKHPHFPHVKMLYESYNISRQAFYKYLNKYKQNPTPKGVAPKKRGPRFKVRRAIIYPIEEKIINLRKSGYNRYQIHHELSKKYKKFTPSPSTIYNILVDKGLNKLKKKMKENRRKIIKEKAGELGHIDCYNLPKGLLEPNKTHYLVGMIDSATRVAFAELVENKKSLTVMFATMDILAAFSDVADIQFKEILSDNGSEFGQGPEKLNKDTNPFEVLLTRYGIKHRYTRPYRPQTNGKIERFWKSLYFDLIEDADFDNLADFKQNLAEYLCYYNEERVHQGINGITPLECNKITPRII